MTPFPRIGLLLLCPVAALSQPAPQAPPPEPPKAQPAPPPAKPGQSTYEETESILSLTLFYWRPRASEAFLAGGRLSPDPPAQTIDLFGRPRATPGIVLTFPTGRSNRVEVSFWETRGSGSTTATRAYNFFGTPFDRDDLLTTEYKIRNGRVTWNYLSYPYPALDSRFRIKTLWEVQWVQATPVITAPLTAIPASGDDPAIPAIRATGKRSLIMPAAGLGVELIPSRKHFRVEARASGMGFSGRAQIWDAEGTAVLRAGNLEVFGGAKLFHFRTTPKKDLYLQADLWGPFAGVRWVFR